MLVKEKTAIAKRLQELIPLLGENHPEGWKDYRQPLPPEWRSGLFVKLPSGLQVVFDGDVVSVTSTDEIDDPDQEIQMASRFASLRIACEAAMLVCDTCRCGARIEEANYKAWRVSFSVPAQEVCW